MPARKVLFFTAMVSTGLLSVFFAILLLFRGSKEDKFHITLIHRDGFGLKPVEAKGMKGESVL